MYNSPSLGLRPSRSVSTLPLEFAKAPAISEFAVGSLRSAKISADALPPHFPRMRLDTKFYRYRIPE